MRTSALALLLAGGLLLSPVGSVATSGPVLAGTPASPDLVSVSSGNGSSCALRSDGSVACWGSNWMGGLGTGTNYDSVIPQPVALDRLATDVTVGESHACALLKDGTLRCWGRNESGQVGSQGFGEAVLLPVTVPGLDHVVSVGAGVFHTCAVRSDGTAWCWGNGGNGQLGQPGLWEGTPPTLVPGITTAVQIAAGDWHTCLLLEDATVTCFGFFPTVDGGDSTRQYEPTPIDGFADVVSLAPGGDFSCGLMSDGTVRCFGANWIGQLGDGTRTSRGGAVPVTGIEDAIAIGAGPTHACAATGEGTLACWGRNVDGELGTPPSLPGEPLPQPVDGIAGVTAVDGGFGFTCAAASGVGMCWGTNDAGQLGDRTVVGRYTPAPLSWVPDSSAPATSTPSVTIRNGKRLDGQLLRVRIAVPVDDGADGTGVDHVEVRVSRDGGESWGPIRWHPSTWKRRLQPAGTFVLGVRAVDRVGNVGEWVETPVLTPRLAQQTSSSVDYAGPWSTGMKQAYSGGSIAYTRSDGAEATISFTGRSFGLVSRTSETRGKFRVFVDGEDAGVVDLYAMEGAYRIVVFTRSWVTSGEHIVRMVALGTAGRPRVDLDAVAVIE